MEISRRLAELSPCPRCGKQPLMFENLGHNRFHMECPPCRVRLWACDSAQEAVASWESLPRVTADDQNNGN